MHCSKCKTKMVYQPSARQYWCQGCRRAVALAPHIIGIDLGYRNKLALSNGMKFASYGEGLAYVLKNYKVICTETLYNLPELERVINMLRVAAGAGRIEHIQIPAFEPSTRRCSSCFVLGSKLSRSIYEWSCKSCGEHHDRDVNAAKNIQRIGESLLAVEAVC